jgi:hypothetical protein
LEELIQNDPALLLTEQFEAINRNEQPHNESKKIRCPMFQYRVTPLSVANSI